MRHQYLHTGKRRLINHPELEKLQAMVETCLRLNANFFRQSSGLVKPNVVTFRYRLCVFLQLAGRADKQLTKLIIDKKAIVNVRNIETGA